MPSVGMRRTTRVFGVVKGVDGARVLRSGRRLWPESGEGKLRRGNDGEEWFKLIDNSTGGGGGGLISKENGWHEVGSKKAVKRMEIDIPKSQKTVPNGNCNLNRKFGVVYSRKRKRSGVQRFDFYEKSGNKNDPDDRMYGIHFVRRQRRKKSGESSVVEAVEQNVARRRMLVVVVESSCSSICSFSCFLNSVLGYMKRARVRLRALSAFVSSQSVALAFSSHGIHFLRDLPCFSSSGICKIFGSRQFTPIFSVDFSALPHYFLYLHSSMLVRSHRWLVVGAGTDDEALVDTDSEDEPSCSTSKGGSSNDKLLASGDDVPMSRRVPNLAVGAPKLTRRSAQCRNALNLRSIRGKRRSLRSRRGRNPSVGVHKPYGVTFVPDIFSSRNDVIPLSSSVSNRGVRRSVRSKLVGNIKDFKPKIEGLIEDLDSTCCSANLLVIESDRCYRDEGVSVMLEIYPSNQWFLVAKKNGSTIYSLKAEKVMRPCTSNRFSHAIIWSAEDSWKLEFPNRLDWFIFKELYKECSQRNVPVSVVKFIPVPGVHEVSGYGDGNDNPFCRPESYITFYDDEISRALAKRTSNYDMDSEDEQWIHKFNNEACAANELYEHVSEENFELMFDAFEKAFYCSPHDYSDEKAASNLCPDLGGREVVQAVYNYWTRKRKQKRSALVRVFQGYQPRRPLINDRVLRKKRSFKRQASQAGRGKQRSVLQAMAAEQDALEEQNFMNKIEEAKASAKQYTAVAIKRRQRAQLLMQIADLATYKATMALRIAEAAQVAESTEAAVLNFLD